MPPFLRSTVTRPLDIQSLKMAPCLDKIYIIPDSVSTLPLSFRLLSADAKPTVCAPRSSAPSRPRPAPLGEIKWAVDPSPGDRDRDRLAGDPLRTPLGHGTRDRDHSCAPGTFYYCIVRIEHSLQPA